MTAPLDLAALRALVDLDVVGSVRALNKALAVRVLAEWNQKNADAGVPNYWPAQQSWDDLVHSSHCILWRAARKEEGIDSSPEFSEKLYAFENALPALLDLASLVLSYRERGCELVPVAKELIEEAERGEAQPAVVLRVTRNEDGTVLPMLTRHEQDTALLAELGGLRADAARLDWLDTCDVRLLTDVIALSADGNAVRRTIDRARGEGR